MNNIKRKSSIELLRILCACGVIILHYNNASIGGGLKYVEEGSINDIYLRLIQSVSCISVNVFVIITGYFQCKKRSISFRKIFELIVLTITVRLLAFLFQVLLATEVFSVKELIIAMLPTNYFVVLYITLYVLSPFLNFIIVSASQKVLKRFVSILFVLFSLCSFTVDCLEKILGGSVISMSTIGMCGSQYGSTIVQFIMMYYIGAYLRFAKVNCSRKVSLVGCVINIFFLYLISVFGARAWYYNNPIVILLSVFSFLLFNTFKIESSIINGLASSVFCCYLTHGYFIQYLNIKAFSRQNIAFLIVHQVIVCITLYLISYIVYVLYNITIGKAVKAVGRHWNALTFLEDCTEIDKII